MSNTTVAVPTKSPLLTDRLYAILKYVAMVILPAMGALYFALSGIWGFPAAEQVVGTIAAVNAFLGLVLRISTVQYEKNAKNDEEYAGTVGYLVHPDGHESIKFDVTKDLESLQLNKKVSFQVVPKHRAPMDEDD